MNSESDSSSEHSDDTYGRPSRKVTKRQRYAKANEIDYADHLASLQGIENLPSGWIAATRPPGKKRANGKYRRPNEEPPITGYAWNNIIGVWAPSVRFVQETSLLAKIKSKKVSTTSSSRSKPLPSSSSVMAHIPAPRIRQPPKRATLDDKGKEFKTESTADVNTKRAGRDVESTYKTDGMDDISTGPFASRTRKRNISQTVKSAGKTPTQPDGLEDISTEPFASRTRRRTGGTFQGDENYEKPPTQSLKNENKSTKVDVKRERDDEESFDDDDTGSDDNEVEVSPTLVNAERKRSRNKKKKNYVDDDADDDDDGNGFHPNSVWQEPHTEELTLYERHRIARPVPKGSILCHMDAIRPEIRCAICLDTLRNTRIVRECLHRFCESCIEQAMTYQNVEAIGGRRKECPICRVYIPSRRSLAPDSYMDTLISRLLDNLIWEEADDPAIYLKSPTKSMNDIGNNSELTSSNENENETNDEVKKNEETSSSQVGMVVTGSPVDDTIPSMIHSNENIPGLIKVVLIQRVDPATRKKCFDDLHQPYLTLASDAPGSVLRNFIYRKLGLFNQTNELAQPQHKTGGNGSNESDECNFLLYTTFRMTPYVIRATDTLQYIIQNRTDPFEGRYMPIYYRGTDPE